jgi:hypothetical protein
MCDMDDSLACIERVARDSVAAERAYGVRLYGHVRGSGCPSDGEPLPSWAPAPAESRADLNAR